jgi:hypothetical protein
VSEFKQKVLTAAVDRYVLTPTQCMMLRQDAQVIGMKRAPVLAKDGVTRTVSRTRTCSSCWVPFAPHYKWLYSIVNELTTAINAEHYRFDITGVQQLQILRYSPLQTVLVALLIRLLDRPQADRSGQPIRANRVPGRWVAS